MVTLNAYPWTHSKGWCGLGEGAEDRGRVEGRNGLEEVNGGERGLTSI